MTCSMNPKFLSLEPPVPTFPPVPITLKPHATQRTDVAQQWPEAASERGFCQDLNLTEFTSQIPQEKSHLKLLRFHFGDYSEFYGSAARPTFWPETLSWRVAALAGQGALRPTLSCHSPHDVCRLLLFILLTWFLKAFATLPENHLLPQSQSHLQVRPSSKATSSRKEFPTMSASLNAWHYDYVS